MIQFPKPAFTGRLLRAAALAGLVAAAPMALAQLAFAPTAIADETKTADNRVVARVNGEEILHSDLVALHQAMPEQVRELPLARIYRPLLEQIVQIRLLSQEGRKAKLHETPAVRRQVEQYEERVLQEAYLRGVVEGKLTEDALKAHYQEYLKSHKTEEEIRARHILVKTRKEADDIIAELEGGADFEKLATERSTGPSKDRGGDLGYFTKGQMVKEFAEAAFALKTGEYTKTPVKTQFGWHVVRLEDRRSKEPPPYEEVEKQIRDDLTQKLAIEEITRLRAEATVELFDPDGKPLEDKEEK